MAFYTYIVASGRNGTLYTGSTDDLVNRVTQHKERSFAGFTAKYDVNQLVWFQIFGTREDAFRKERRIKKWNRLWKLQMIDTFNPDWRDLYDELRLGGLKDAADWVPAFAGMSGEVE